MLQFARSLGDNLIVGIDSDKRVELLKGSNRPINNQNDRVEFLRSIKYVDDVFVFDSKENMCDILIREGITDMVIGQEYKDRQITGKDIITNIHFFSKVEGFSTTEIVNEIRS